MSSQSNCYRLTLVLELPNRSLSAFTSVVREYLDPLVKADRCAQYVDDIGIAAHTPEELITNLELVFQQLDRAGLQLNMGKCEFGQKQIEYLGKTNSSAGFAPIEKRVTDYLNKLKPPTQWNHCNVTLVL